MGDAADDAERRADREVEEEGMPGTRSAARPRVEEVAAEAVAPDAAGTGAETDGAGADGGATGAPSGRTAAPRSLPVLPTAKTSLSGILEEKTVLLFGPAGIGKSTLASEWAGGGNLFFDTAGELTDLEVFRVPVGGWVNFREWCASYKAAQEQREKQYTGCVIDTADLLGTFCAQHIRGKLKVAHESDADWGKGWTLVREEFTSHLAKLQALPGGVVLISHSKDEKIEKKTRSRDESYVRQIPTLTGGARDACVNAADLVLFLDYDDDGENRVIYTKPSKFHEAKERGMTPRLPEVIPWPYGVSGWKIIKEAWDGGTQ